MHTECIQVSLLEKFLALEIQTEPYELEERFQNCTQTYTTCIVFQKTNFETVFIFTQNENFDLEPEFNLHFSVKCIAVLRKDPSK